MASRTMPAIVGIAIYVFLVCIVNTVTAEITTTQNHSSTLENSPASTSTTAETSLSPAIDVTNTTLSTTIALNVSEVSQFSTATSISTTQSTVNESRSLTSKATTALSSQSSSTAPLTGSSTTAENITYTTKTSATAENITYTTKTSGVISTTLQTESTPTPQYNGTTTPNVNASTEVSDTENHSMKYSEIILTSIFSTILVIVVLVIVSYGFKRCFRGRFQYSHQPLRETSYEAADSYSPPDDTLVISGGLYDAPRIYNPNMTVLEEEEPQNDCTSFSSRPGQFRLEFLPGDKDLDPMFSGSQRRNV